MRVLLSIADTLGVNIWDFPVDFAPTMADVCESAMITCDKSYSRITGIVVHEQNIASELRSFSPLWKLKGLVILVLSGNSLTGELPKEWAALESIQDIRLDDNELSGTLPKEWASLRNLSRLSLSTNRLSGQLPTEWAALESIQDIRLDDNELSGTLPKEWASLRNLSRLNLSINRLSGQFPTEWAALESIQDIQLYDNELSGTLPKEWASLRNLSLLSLSINKLSGQLPTEWAALESIQDIWLDDNELSGTLPKEWASLRNLSVLSLSTNRLSGQLPMEWVALESIRHINLGENELSGTLPKEWASLRNLSGLYLSTNRLSGQLPTEWAALESIQHIHLGENELSGTLPTEWASLAKLQVLNLSSNSLGGTLPGKLSNLSNLQSFNVASNLFSGGLEHVLVLPTLLLLNASGNLLTGPVSFVGEKSGGNLVRLLLSGNHFDRFVSAADFAMSDIARTVPLVVDLRQVEFICPFPTVESIRDASAGLPPLILRDPCEPDFRIFVMLYLLPGVGAFTVLFLCWKLQQRYVHALKGKCQFACITHFRPQAVRLFLFLFMLYDNINDSIVYKTMFEVVDGDTFDDPCAVVNYRELWYDSMPYDFINSDQTRFPAFVCGSSGGNANCRESNFTTFTQYVYYVDREDGWLQSGLDENVDHFVSICNDFYVVGGIHECSYSNATVVSWIDVVSYNTRCQKSSGIDELEGCRIEGPEGCVRVRNVEREKNLDYKPFVVASLVVFAGKEFAKALYVLFVLLRVSTRQLQPLEVALVGESPFVLLLLWRRPGFKQELLFAKKTWQSLLALFFIEDVLEGVNQVALVVIFSVTISRRGVDSAIMFSMVASTLKVVGRLYALAITASKTFHRNITVKVQDETSLAIVRTKALNENSLKSLQDEIASTTTNGDSVPAAEEASASSSTTVQ
jgi:hypothetical protein